MAQGIENVLVALSEHIEAAKQRVQAATSEEKQHLGVNFKPVIFAGPSSLEEPDAVPFSDGQHTVNTLGGMKVVSATAEPRSKVNAQRYIALDESTGSNDTQRRRAVQYHRMLGCIRSDYERQDVARPKPVQMAQVSWSTAERLKRISDCAFAIEAYRRGLRLVGANRYFERQIASRQWKAKHRSKTNL